MENLKLKFNEYAKTQRFTDSQIGIINAFMEMSHTIGRIDQLSVDAEKLRQEFYDKEQDKIFSSPHPELYTPD